MSPPQLDTPVVILAGGLGTRLAGEAEFRPKPLVKIGRHPVLWHIMKIFSHFGFRNFIICLGHKGEMIREYFYHYQVNTGDVLFDAGSRTFTPIRAHEDDLDWKVLLADTGEETMTGGRIARIAPYVGTDDFLVTYGDGVADIDVQALVDTHRRLGKTATVTGIQPTSRFGELMVSEGLVSAFREKQASDGWVNGGFFVFNKRIFEHLDGDRCVLEQSPLRTLAEERDLAVYQHRGFWQCMDTMREVELLNRLWADSSRPPWKVWG